jgi:hypothetical protein
MTMKPRWILCAVLLFAFTVPAIAQEGKAKTAGSAGKSAAAPQKMDPQAMADMMAKMAAVGPQHERFKKMAGTWDLSVKWTWDPTQPMQESKSTSVMTTLMDGRYCQEQSTGDMMGKPFHGMGIYGYDNVLKKYVSIWIDDMGTGIMNSLGTPDASGNVVNWVGETSDPGTGKMSKVRMVTRYTDDDHFVYEMYIKDPAGKEYKTMEIAYARKMM